MQPLDCCVATQPILYRTQCSLITENILGLHIGTNPFKLHLFYFLLATCFIFLSAKRWVMEISKMINRTFYFGILSLCCIVN